MYSATQVISAISGAFDARSVLCKLTEADDKNALVVNAAIRTIFDFSTSRKLTSVSALAKRRPVKYFLCYNALPPKDRHVIRRLLKWPKSWTTVYQLLEMDAWLPLAKLSLGKARFDSEGGGVWLEKHNKELYWKVVNATARFWRKPVGNDGIHYDSIAEAIHGSLLFHNRKILRYRYKPQLPFCGPGEKVPRHCDGDFEIEVLPGVPHRFNRFYVENWMRFDTVENQESKYVSTRLAIKQRRFKIRKYAQWVLRLVQTESQVHRDHGSAAYLGVWAAEEGKLPMLNW